MADVDRIVAAYGTAMAALRTNTDRYIAREWSALGEYRDAQIAAFAAKVGPVIEATNRRAAALTAAYLAQVGREVLGRAKTVSIPAGLVTVEAMRGVPRDEVYQRPGKTVWYALSRGVLPPDAIAQGLDRARAIAATDLQLSTTHAARHVMDEAGGSVTGFKRVTHGVCCELCATAATNTYKRKDLMPIHAHCSCSVIPTFRRESVSPPQGTPADVERGKPVVRTHGELGPVLVAAGDSFRTL